MRYSLRRKEKKRLASNAACPNSLCSVRPGDARQKVGEEEFRLHRYLGVPASRRPATQTTTLHPANPPLPPKKKSCLFAVKIIEWRSVCLRSLRRLRCQDSLFLYFFIPPPVCCLAPHLIREGYKKITSEGDESRQLFVHLYSYFLSKCFDTACFFFCCFASQAAPSADDVSLRSCALAISLVDNSAANEEIRSQIFFFCCFFQCPHLSATCPGLRPNPKPITVAGCPPPSALLFISSSCLYCFTAV